MFITRRFIACSPLSYPKLAAISLTPGSHIWYPHRWRFERPGWAREFGETSSPAPSNATRSAKQLETGQVRDWASQASIIPISSRTVAEEKGETITLFLERCRAKIDTTSTKDSDDDSDSTLPVSRPDR